MAVAKHLLPSLSGCLVIKVKSSIIVSSTGLVTTSPYGDRRAGLTGTAGFCFSSNLSGTVKSASKTSLWMSFLAVSASGSINSSPVLMLVFNLKECKYKNDKQFS